MMTAVWWVCLMCYGLTMGYIVKGLLRGQLLSKNLVLGLTVVGLVAHAAVLYPKIATPFGLNFNLYNVLSLTSWLVLLFYVGFCLLRPIVALGVLALPLALGGAMVGYLADAPYHAIYQLSPMLQAHIVASIAAYCLLVMAAVQAVVLRLQIAELKRVREHPLWVNRLPALQSMEALLFDMIGAGFVLLTVALGLGFADTTNLLAQHLTHKMVFSVLSWLVFGALLIGHWRYGWRGARAANMTLYGVALLAIAFLGTKFVLEVVLQRG